MFLDDWVKRSWLVQCFLQSIQVKNERSQNGTINSTVLSTTKHNSVINVSKKQKKKGILISKLDTRNMAVQTKHTCSKAQKFWGRLPRKANTTDVCKQSI